MGSVFKAEKSCFQGIEGYMVSQINNGEIMVKQFISEDDYEDFCKAIGVKPELNGISMG